MCLCDVVGPGALYTFICTLSPPLCAIMLVQWHWCSCQSWRIPRETGHSGIPQMPRLGLPWAQALSPLPILGWLGENCQNTAPKPFLLSTLFLSLPSLQLPQIMFVYFRTKGLLQRVYKKCRFYQRASIEDLSGSNKRVEWFITEKLSHLLRKSDKSPLNFFKPRVLEGIKKILVGICCLYKLGLLSDSRENQISLRNKSQSFSQNTCCGKEKGKKKRHTE